MGNTFSNNRKNNFNEEKIKFLKIINDIASKLILTQTYDDFTKMGNEKYCSQIVDLTSKLLKINLNKNTIKHLYSGKFIDNLDNKEKTKELCYSVSSFYVKVAQVFSAIVKVVNPIKEYNDPFTNNITYNELIKLDAKNNIDIFKMNTSDNLCEKRINAMSKIYKILENKKEISLKNIREICTYNKFVTGYNKGKYTSNLIEEPGIKELENLYNDISLGIIFKNKSNNNKKQYQDDLNYFYKVFTGKDPEKNLKSFKDIPIDDYFKSKTFCLTKPFTVSIKNVLFQEYLNQIQKTKTDYIKFQNELISTLKTLFIVQDGTNIVINPKLNIENLNNIVNSTRRTIMMLYISCEENFKQGVKILDAIIAEQTRLQVQQDVIQEKNKRNNPDDTERFQTNNEPLTGDKPGRVFVDY